MEKCAEFVIEAGKISAFCEVFNSKYNIAFSIPKVCSDKCKEIKLKEEHCEVCSLFKVKI